VIRNEAGDASGWGSKVCRARADTLGVWECKSDIRKFDSPLLFRHGSDVYLVARRNLGENGAYDLGRRDLPSAQQTRLYQLAYWQTPKRCTVWRVTSDLAVSPVVDLPSRGDTCFPALLPLGSDVVEIYNYSSPLEGPDDSWLKGQLGPTQIYRARLSFAQN